MTEHKPEFRWVITVSAAGAVRLILWSVFLLVVSPLLVGWSPPDDVVETQKLRIVDKEGRMRAELGTNDQGEVFLSLLDFDLHPRITLWATAKDAMGIVLQAEPGSRKILIKADPLGNCQMLFMNEKFEASTGIVPTVTLNSTPEGNASLKLWNVRESLEAELSVKIDKGGGLSITSGGEPRSDFVVDAAGTSKIVLRDADGNTVESLPK